MKLHYTRLGEEELRALVLRQSDLDEMAATTTLPAGEVLVQSARVSDWWWAVRAGRRGPVLAVFGVSPYHGAMPGIGCPWFLATDGVYRYRKQLLRPVRYWLDKMNQQYRVLCQHVDARHKAALGWVAWHGFDVVQTTTPGLNGETLIQVTRS